MIDCASIVADYEIESVDSTSTEEIYPSVEETVAIIRGNVAINNGYTGSGIRVGTVESYIPVISTMGDYGTNITYAQSGPFGSHATSVCTIIKRMAPDCSVYAFSLIGYNETDDKVVKACQYLIKQYNVHAINISYGDTRSGEYNAESAELDELIRNADVTIIAAAGNNKTNNPNVSNYAIAPNVTAVGAVNSSGTSQSADGAYTYTDYMCYCENDGMINKPDISAPGNLNLYGENIEGTSFSAPHVTGTVVQMISRNAGLGDKQTIIKAALMASATYDVSTQTSSPIRVGLAWEQP